MSSVSQSDYKCHTSASWMTKLRFRKLKKHLTKYKSQLWSHYDQTPDFYKSDLCFYKPPVVYIQL